MDEIVTNIEIDGSPEAVWAVLTSFEAHPEWNPTMEIDGDAVEGDRLELTMDFEALLKSSTDYMFSEPC